MRSIRIDRRGLLAAAALAPWPAAAQAWPTRPLRLVVPFPPGGLVDVLARAISQRLTERLGQPVVVENRAGAGGNIGADVVAKAAPDGHTLLATSLGPVAVNQFIYRSMPFETDTAFAPIVLLASTPKVLCVAPDRPWRSVADVVAAAKARPGVLTAGSAGPGSSLHLALELFKRTTGTDIQHIPYRGAAPAVTDLVAGQIDMAIDNLPNILGQITAGRVRALAVATPGRLPQLPDVPTMAEGGFDFVFGTAFGLVAPAGTPDPILLRLAEAVTAALRDPAVGGRLAQQGALLGGGTPGDFAALIAREKATLAPVIRAAGIRAE
ncbi:Bug family tripartite tricarboxylate transporter substrate binding protein [Falsiroseomonas selenitidurans]|uniref:Tripartite tricarboxylate transporter substrate binding protein n=1 Tax=Falsiroseomonas selenitidurans TaxID=2716335 RepID=A0ABX1E242_9PROT|nr:tripartite tricarboxylate transporter substrate binding protein [Falsiroseomonas selenitidurans]NKC31235.1 tripartite tricarboxylate transporter substrate binding protein [Falsiroseomonas selenitidurans]